MIYSRRGFVRIVSLAGGALPFAGSAFARSVLTQEGCMSGTWVPAQQACVLSFHLDQPYVDTTGEAKPYLPPAGARSGAPLAALSDEQLSRYYGFI